MSEFDDVVAPAPPRGTARFTLARVFWGSDQEVVLIGKHAGRTNPGFAGAMLKQVTEGSGGGGLTVAKLDRSDERTIKLFARHVIVGWEHAVGKDGQPRPFNAKLCEEFLLFLLRERKMTELVGVGGAMDVYFSNPDNFREDASASAAALGEG